MFLKLILGCWDVFVLFCLINMFTNKRTIERQSIGSRLLYSIPFLASFWLLFGGFARHRAHLFQQIVLPHSAITGAIGLAVTVLGLALAIWARVVLGRNWSGTVTLKENHELVVRGPYAYVRHPIYTAMSLMVLGTAIAVGTPGGFVAFPLVVFSFWIKYRQEEAFMIQQFGDQYRDYMKRVRAILPFVF
jgi:protein-S-isoprenylcysteine O-methyltransferase Ste14